MLPTNNFQEIFTNFQVSIVNRYDFHKISIILISFSKSHHAILSHFYSTSHNLSHISPIFFTFFFKFREISLHYNPTRHEKTWFNTDAMWFSSTLPFLPTLWKKSQPFRMFFKRGLQHLLTPKLPTSSVITLPRVIDSSTYFLIILLISIPHNKPYTRVPHCYSLSYQ